MNNDWKPTENNIPSPWDVSVQENNIGQPINWTPKPQSPDEVADGLRNAFRQAKEDGVFDVTTIRNPKVICRCDLFGQEQLVISFTDIHPNRVPNRWIRFWTRVFFNTKWHFEND